MTPIEHGLVAVVDDDASILSALWRLLVAHRYRVKTFASAEELLRSPELDHASCVVSDIHLGEGMSGIDLGEAILARGRGTPFVFMSGSANEEVLRSALSLSGSAVLEKPFSPEKLIEAVSRAVGPER